MSEIDEVARSVWNDLKDPWNIRTYRDALVIAEGEFAGEPYARIEAIADSLWDIVLAKKRAAL